MWVARWLSENCVALSSVPTLKVTVLPSGVRTSNELTWLRLTWSIETTTPTTGDAGRFVGCGGAAQAQERIAAKRTNSTKAGVPRPTTIGSFRNVRGTSGGPVEAAVGSAVSVTPR